jgi:hypothetical protein
MVRRGPAGEPTLRVVVDSDSLFVDTMKATCFEGRAQLTPRAGWLLGATLVLATAAGARADEKADALIQASREATARIETLQADLAIRLGKGRTVTGTVIAKRPNLFRLEMKGYPIETIGSDGKVLWRGVGFNEKAVRDALAAAGVK